MKIEYTGYYRTRGNTLAHVHKLFRYPKSRTCEGYHGCFLMHWYVKSGLYPKRTYPEFDLVEYLGELELYAEKRIKEHNESL